LRIETIKQDFLLIFTSRRGWLKGEKAVKGVFVILESEVLLYRKKRDKKGLEKTGS